MGADTPNGTRPGTPANGAATPTPAVATIHNLRVGCKAYAQKDGELRQAEILSIQIRQGEPHFYVHWKEYNKRLDEWIPPSRLDLDKEVEWPVSQKAANKKAAAGPKGRATPEVPTPPPKATHKRQKTSHRDSPTPGPGTPRLLEPQSTARVPSRLSFQLPFSQEDLDAMDLDDDDTEIKTEDPGATTDASGIREGEEMDLDANHSDNPVYVSREQEIEKLRTSGSMTQDTHEIARVKNFSLIQIGKFEVEPWYFSPYPVELTEYEKLYICEFCFCYFGPRKSFERHRSKCNLFHPPGNEIYRQDDVSFFEIDGRRQRTWCRNLCLLSKLFLDHKTLYYDVDPFMFYCMCVRDEYGAHLYGYFSKEKESAEGYNVACILTLPQYQRLGYGKLLIAFSYELSKKEGKLGSPEKPLSDLGLLSYRAYWTETLVNILVNHTEDINLDELAAMTAMTTNDVMNTLKHLGMLKFAQGKHYIVLTDHVVEQYNKQKTRRKRTINPDSLVWTPPVFTASQLRFGF